MWRKRPYGCSSSGWSTPEGYRPLKAVQDQLRAEIVKDKKAEKIMADMKAANATSLDQYKAMPAQSAIL